jgi:hypothetical protein
MTTLEKAIKLNQMVRDYMRFAKQECGLGDVTATIHVNGIDIDEMPDGSKIIESEYNSGMKIFTLGDRCEPMNLTYIFSKSRGDK